VRSYRQNFNELIMSLQRKVISAKPILTG